METILYFVRHAESVFVEGKERIRGLSDQGKKDAEIVKDILKFNDIDRFVSSPFERAIETIRPLAMECQMKIHIEEDLRERRIGEFAPLTFKEAKYRVYEDREFAFPRGESGIAAQKRAVGVIKSLIQEFKGKTIVVGIHGDIMTLILNHFDQTYGYTFWEAATIPDIYKLEYKELELNKVIRMWK